MMFILSIDPGNAAFDERNAEVARILRELADKMERGGDEWPLYDVNGNRVGKAEFVA